MKDIMNNRAVRLLLSAVLTFFFMGILVVCTSEKDPNRLLVMMGGTMPEGLIQGFTYFLFFFGICEVLWVSGKITHENDAFSAHLLPEKENWVLSADDVSQLKLNMQSLERSQKFYMTDLIKKACTKYRLSKSSSEVLDLVDAQVRIYQEELESEQSFIGYVAWAIPSVGFIGTVIGIAASLGYAGAVSTPEGITKVTDMLSVAFDTTLVALVLSIILMLGIHNIRKRQDSLFAHINAYLIENLINRFYK